MTSKANEDLARAKTQRSGLLAAIAGLFSQTDKGAVSNLFSLNATPARSNDNSALNERGLSGAALAIPSNDNGLISPKRRTFLVAVVLAAGTTLWSDKLPCLAALHYGADKPANDVERPKGDSQRTHPRSSAKARELVDRMMHDFQLTKIQAAAAVGWMAFESGNFVVLQEKQYNGVHSGYGWAQWTSARRMNFFNYVKTENLDPASDAANYRFMTKELNGPYRRALVELRKTMDLPSASYAWGHFFEGMSVNGPGVPAWGLHLDSAQWVLSEYDVHNR